MKSDQSLNHVSVLWAALSSFRAFFHMSQAHWQKLLNIVSESRDPPTQQHWAPASQQHLQSKLSSVLALFMGLPLRSEQKESKRLEITYLPLHLKPNLYRKWNTFPLKILNCFSPCTTLLCIETFFKTRVYYDYLKLFSDEDNGACACPLRFPPLTIFHPLSFQQGHFCKLFFQIVIEFSLNPINHTVKSKEKFDAF